MNSKKYRESGHYTVYKVIMKDHVTADLEVQIAIDELKEKGRMWSVLDENEKATVYMWVKEYIPIDNTLYERHTDKILTAKGLLDWLGVKKDESN